LDTLDKKTDDIDKYKVITDLSITSENALSSKVFGVKGTLSVSNGGTGSNFITANALLIGNGANEIKEVLSAKGALYVATDNAEPSYGILPINCGGTGMMASPSMLINLGATNADTIFKASPRPGVTGVLSVANGGTGKSSWAKN
jgi:hypothetical protein